MAGMTSVRNSLRLFFSF